MSVGDTQSTMCLHILFSGLWGKQHSTAEVKQTLYFRDCYEYWVRDNHPHTNADLFFFCI